MTTEEPTAVNPEDIFNTIVADAAAHGAATDAFIKSFTFYGKSLEEHSTELYIDIPPDPNPEDIRNCFLQLTKNIQIANHFLSVASSISSALTSGSQTQKSDLVAVIARGYESRNARRPGAGIIERMADNYMSDTANVRIAAKIVKDFWKGKVDSLIEVRRCLEGWSMNQATELKYLAGA